MNKIKLIAHRGNLNGRIPEKENKPSYIIEAIDSGFDCEIDLRMDKKNRLHLGHDENQYRIEPDFLLEYSKNLWVHCKDRDSLNLMVTDEKYRDAINYFFHITDDYTITSKGYVWAYPNKQMTDQNCVMVVLDQNAIDIIAGKDLSSVANPFGICTDWVVKLSSHTSIG